MQIFEFLILAAAIRLVKDTYGKIQKKKILLARKIVEMSFIYNATIQYLHDEAST